MDVKNEILTAVEWEHKVHYDTVEEAVEEYGMINVFDCWMKKEGLVGYTADILNVLAVCGFDVSIDE